MMEFMVEHDTKNERFKINSGGESAFVSYSVSGDTINFNSTYTPLTLRGKGMAAVIVRKAFEYAREKNYKVTSGCSYVLAFVQRNAEYKYFMK